MREREIQSQNRSILHVKHEFVIRSAARWSLINLRRTPVEIVNSGSGQLCQIKPAAAPVKIGRTTARPNSGSWFSFFSVRDDRINCRESKMWLTLVVGDTAMTFNGRKLPITMHNKHGRSGGQRVRPPKRGCIDTVASESASK